MPADADTHVAFLRAINVGGRNRVAMAALRELLQGLGYGAVRTHLQSGNAIFIPPADASPDSVERDIEAALAKRLEVPARVLVRTRSQLERVVAANPLLDVADDHARLLVLFLSATPSPERLHDLTPAAVEPEAFALGEREIYVWYPDGVGRTRLGNAFFERRLDVVGTGRNWRTVTRLLEMIGE